EPDDREDRYGPKPLVDPVAGEDADQGRDQEREADLREEDCIGRPSTGLDHAPPGKATGVYQRARTTTGLGQGLQNSETATCSPSDVVLPSSPVMVITTW